MILLFLLGWLLLAAAFVAAAFTAMARLYGGPSGPFVSAYDLLYTYWPGNLVVAQIWVEKNLSPAVWEYALVPALALPAWLLLGLPGGLMVWGGWPHQGEPATDEHDDSVFDYDRLADEARSDETFVAGEDDRAPDHGPHDAVEREGIPRPEP